MAITGKLWAVLVSAVLLEGLDATARTSDATDVLVLSLAVNPIVVRLAPPASLVPTAGAVFCFLFLSLTLLPFPPASPTVDKARFSPRPVFVGGVFSLSGCAWAVEVLAHFTGSLDEHTICSLGRRGMDVDVDVAARGMRFLPLAHPPPGTGWAFSCTFGCSLAATAQC